MVIAFKFREIGNKNRYVKYILCMTVVDAMGKNEEGQ